MVRFHPTVEIAFGAHSSGSPSSWSWTDLTLLRYVHNPTGISITRGRIDRVSEATPATCGLTLLNPGGIWVPDNPAGAYYGQFDINTPIRVLMRSNTNSASDTFNRQLTSSWGSADAGGAWTNTGGAASDYSVDATSGGRHLHGAATTNHWSTLAFSMVRSDVYVRVRVNALSTGAAQTAAVVSRYADSSNSWRAELQFGTSGAMTARLVLRSAGADSPSSATATALTHTTSAWYRMRLQTGFNGVRFKVWLDGTSEPATWLIDGTAGFFGSAAAGAIGVFSVRESGNTNANATIDFDDFVMVDGPIARFTGYVDSWPTSWTDPSERQPLAAITASGHLARLADAKALRSSLFRALSTDPSLVAYWPLEDGSGSSAFASATGGPPTPFTDTSPGSDSEVTGSDPLPVFGGTSHVIFNVPRYAPSTSWSLRFVCKVPSSPPTDAQLISWLTPSGSSIVRWQFTITPGSPDTIFLSGWGPGGSVVFTGSAISFVDSAGNEAADGRQLYFEVDGTQSGSDIEVTWNCDAVGGRVDTAPSATIGNISGVYFDGGVGFPDGGVVLGHIAVGVAPLAVGTGPVAAKGYVGDETSTRLSRLAGEIGASAIFGEILGTIDGQTGQKMGPQRSAAPLDELREIEATENGVLFDGLQGQVTILPRSLRYNHPVDLALDHDASQLKDGFTIARDTQQIRNDLEVTNQGGFRATAADATSIARYGSRPQTVSINALSDGDAVRHATWRRSAGKDLDRRYPAVTLDLHSPANAALIDSWLACDIGSRVTIDNLPQTFDTADLLIDGYTETFDSEVWQVVLNLSPARPFDAMVVESTDGNLGRADTSGSSLLVGYDATSTSLLVATTPGKRQWSTTAEPYDWAVSGERMTVTAMNTNAAEFVAAGTATHANNASLTPSLPAGVQKGDLLLVFCAIRNTSATITTPTGYTVLMSDGNVALFGKIHTGTESAPTVAFAGGSAGDTTSAQMAAFRYTQCTAALVAKLSNSSAQNIAVPAAVPPLHNAVALWLGWKQDDWTSVATVYGTEIGEPDSTTGNQQGIVWDYQIQTTATERASSSFAVTGGSSAISKGFVVWLPSDVQSCTVTRSVNGVAKSQAAGTAVSLWRPGTVAL